MLAKLLWILSGGPSGDVPVPLKYFDVLANMVEMDEDDLQVLAQFLKVMNETGLARLERESGGMAIRFTAE
jgi:hypothetical protein